ncbi:MAG: hypothetical protein ACJ790_21400, partial [Myxococcaceae bacterium]
QRKLAGELVHYATGTVWGALFGAALAHRKSRLGRAAIFATLLWLFQDELVVPLLGLANRPRDFPLTTHAKALLAHLVYGESVAGFVALFG